MESIWNNLLGFALALMAAAITWLVASVLSLREARIESKGKIEKLEADVQKLQTDQITEECVRKVIEGALEKRDHEYDKRRVEWDHLRKLEVREAVREEMDKAVKRFESQRGSTTGKEGKS